MAGKKALRADKGCDCVACKIAGAERPAAGVVLPTKVARLFWNSRTQQIR